MASRDLPPTRWRHHALEWGSKTYVMAVVNVTPDSFSGDGVGSNVVDAVALAARAIAAGADIIDIGGESTRPGHTPVSAAEEIARVVPVIDAVRKLTAIPISIDTSKAAVADAAIASGASMVNDVRGFTHDPEIATVAARLGVPAVVVHDVAPDRRADLVTDIIHELSRRLDIAVSAGISWDYLIVDPGFGFGKDWRQNLELLHRLRELIVLERPILIGLSRKKTIAHVLGNADLQRLEGTMATTALAIANGAEIVRVHDVLANVRVSQMSDAVVRGVPAESKLSPLTKER